MGSHLCIYTQLQIQPASSPTPHFFALSLYLQGPWPPTLVLAPPDSGTHFVTSQGRTGDFRGAPQDPMIKCIKVVYKWESL